MKALKAVGIIVLLFFLAKELASAYSQIGLGVIPLIVFLLLIGVGVAYLLKRNKPRKDKL